MEERDRDIHSELLTLRVWREALGEGQAEWRGAVRHVLSGQLRYFRGWEMLAEQLTGMLEGLQPASPEEPGRAERT